MCELLFIIVYRKIRNWFECNIYDGTGFQLPESNETIEPTLLLELRKWGTRRGR